MKIKKLLLVIAAISLFSVTQVGIGQTFPVNNLTASGTIVSTGNVTAPTFIGGVTGHASLDLPLTGGTLSGPLTVTGSLSATGAFTQASTGNFYSNTGGLINKLNDRLLVGSGATSYNGASSASSPSWVNSASGGIYEYLELNSVLNAYADAHGIGQFNAARTSVTGGSSSNVAIGAATFANNDYAAGGVGAWGNYATVIRQSSATGPTQGMEIDIANMGSLVPVYPNNPHATSLTGALSLEAGGESTISYHVGTASYALGIGRNDSNATPSANFDKGIVFDANSLSGANGVSGTGVAIAMAPGHQITWYNNSNVLSGLVRSDTTTAANGTGLVFNNFGTSIINSADGSTQFQVSGISNAINRIGVQPSLAGSPAQIQAQGGDTNIGISIIPKGSGAINLSAPTTNVNQIIATSILNTGGTTNSAASAGTEYGSTTSAGTPYIDWHSSGNANDYDVRLIASGGTTNGTGILNVIGTNFQVNGTNVYGSLAATTGSIGGSALLAGACASGTVAVTGATTSMTVSASPNTYPGDGFYQKEYVSAAGTVTVKVCASAAGTPTASTYNVRVIQ